MTLAPVGAGLRSRARALRTIAVKSGVGDGHDVSEPWRAASEVLSETLRERGARTGRVHIVLSDHFVRYLLLPWSPDLVSDKERLSFARLAFKDLYGDAADSWELCLDEQPAGEASFACAVDRALVSSLQDGVTRAGATLHSLVPALADRINRYRVALKAPQFCFVAAEPGRVSLAFRSSGAWRAVRSRRINGELAQALPVLLKQEAVVGDAIGGGVLYLCPDAMPTAFPVAGWQTVRLGEGLRSRRSRSDGHVAPVGS